MLILSKSPFGVQLQYVNENANISAKVSGTQPHPEVELSLGLGTSCLSAGGSALFDARTQRIMSARAGKSLLSPVATCGRC